MTAPKFTPVDMEEMKVEGVLMAANEAFFWPLGLALTWTVSTHAVDEHHWCGNENIHAAHTDEAADWHGECGGTVAGEGVFDLHIREWLYEDGHHERIELSPDDAVGDERRARFLRWLDARIESMPEDERGPAETLRGMRGRS